MLRPALLFIALAGLQARPLPHNLLRFQNGGWVIGAPQLVQDQFMDNLVYSDRSPLNREPSIHFPTNMNNGHLKKHSSETDSKPKENVVPAPAAVEVKLQDNLNQKAVAAQAHRQGTEPSRRFLVDLNTGLLKEHLSEMDRRVSGFYNYPSNDEFRQGTENSQATLVDIRSGHLLTSLSEMQRRTALSEEIVAGDALEILNAQPVEIRRQGTEPSRRFLVDLNTGLLKNHLNEMDRRVSGFYNFPSNNEFRQGTENSQATLVDIRSGHLLAPQSEMQRRTSLSEGVVGGDEPEIQTAQPVELRRQGTEPSRRFLVDLNTGLLKEQSSEMDRRVSGFYNYPSNYEFRQGTEPSRRFLVDLNTGILQTDISEMNRRASGFYNPSLSSEFKQGTENSRKTLVDIRTGQQLSHLSEMQRRTSPLDEFRQGTEYSLAALVELRRAELIANMERAKFSKDEMFEQGSMEHSPEISPELQSNSLVEGIGATEVEFRLGTGQAQNMELHQSLENNEVDVSAIEGLMHDMEYSHANIINNHIMDPKMWKNSKDDGVTTCQGEEIDGKCYYFNPNLLTFSEAEASCKAFSSLGHLASVTSADLQLRLVELLTRTKGDRVLTWLGGIMKDHHFEWIDGSSLEYSDWMPGHPHTEKHGQSCMEMFRMDESWWTAADCDLKKASLCSYPVTAQ